MVGKGYRRRPRRRNNNRRMRSRNNATQMRGMFRRREQAVSNRPTMRPRPPGFNNLGISCVRRLASYPSSGFKPSPDKPAPASAWWLDTLKWSGSLALQLLGLFISTTREADPKATQFVITGCGSSIAISPSDLLAFTPLASGVPGKPALANCPFEQGRIVWVRAHISPSPDLGSRGGFYTAAFVPVQPDNGKQVIGEVAHDFDLLSVQPGSVIRPVTSPISVSWSPTLIEQGIQWRNLGVTGNEGNINSTVVLAIAFSDLATDAQPSSKDEYRPSRALLEIHLDGRVEVRRPGYVQLSRNLIYSDPTKMTVTHYGDQYSIPCSHVTWDSGIGRVEGHSLSDLELYKVSASDQLNLNSMMIE